MTRTPPLKAPWRGGLLVGALSGMLRAQASRDPGGAVSSEGSHLQLVDNVISLFLSIIVHTSHTMAYAIVYIMTKLCSTVEKCMMLYSLIQLDSDLR